MGAEVEALAVPICLRLQLIHELMKLQEGLDSSAPVHLEIEKRIKILLDLIEINLDKQIKEST